jgi:hypothetical protein
MWQDTKSDWKDANQKIVDGLSDGLVEFLVEHNYCLSPLSPSIDSRTFWTARIVESKMDKGFGESEPNHLIDV